MVMRASYYSRPVKVSHDILPHHHRHRLSHVRRGAYEHRSFLWPRRELERSRLLPGWIRDLAAAANQVKG